MANEAVDGSPGRNSTFCSNANETIKFMYQTNCKWRLSNALCHFFYLMFPLPVFLSVSSKGTIFLCVLQSFSLFYVAYLLISFPSYLHRHNYDISTFSHFYLTTFFILSSNPSIPFFLILCSEFSAPAFLNIFNLFTLSLSLTRSCSLWCVPHPAFVLNLWKFMRHASSYCITGWKSW